MPPSSRTPLERLAAAAALTLVAVLGGRATPALADTHVIGDSLTHQTYESSGWDVDAKDGRSLQASVTRVVNKSRRFPDDTIIVALGSNDVSQRSRTMATDIRLAINGAEAVARSEGHCLVMTTVKVYGVTGFYAHGEWVKWARRWNRAVWNADVNVANWTPVARAHPEYFLADGLHLTRKGEGAYDRFLHHAVAASCPEVVAP
jgi:hypothetical protein